MFVIAYTIIVLWIQILITIYDYYKLLNEHIDEKW
jgi:hypothetical protein